MPSDTPVDTLFLHGGPGLCTLAERRLYGQSLPVHWWDQPRSVALFARPYGDLIEFALDEVDGLAEAAGGPVRIVAHSFGAPLALDVAMRVPDKIAALTLLAPVHDVGLAFTRVAQAVAKTGEDPAALLQARERYLDDPSNPDRLLALTRATMAVPNFLDVYWAPESCARRDWFYALMTEESLFDLAVFEAVLGDYAARGSVRPVAVPIDCPVRLVFGARDPAVVQHEDLAYWCSYPPQVTCSTLKTGHMIQLECPPSAWFSAGDEQLPQIKDHG
jgi:pimeloyl-ACP methyl ester carboxylesterase